MGINCYNCEKSLRIFGFKRSFEKMIEEQSKYNCNPCLSAAEHGHIECLKKHHKNMDSSIIGVCDVAAENGNIECLEYAHKNGDIWSDKACILACESNSISCLKYLHENGCPWDRKVCETAAEYDHLECLKYAHENGCPWDEMTLYKAIENNNLECLKYAHLYGCPDEIEMIDTACRSNNVEILEYVHKFMKLPFSTLSSVFSVLKNGHIECLKYLYENGAKLTTNTMQFALEDNNKECIKYLIDIHCPMDQYVNIMAVRFCDLEIVKYLYEKHIIKLNKDYLLKHVLLNKFQVLKYVLEKGCPYSSDIIDDIINLDKAGYLKYFQKEYKMSIDKSNFIYMIKQDAIACLKYVYKNTNLFDVYFCNNMYMKSRKKCRKFLKQIMCKNKI